MRRMLAVCAAILLSSAPLVGQASLSPHAALDRLAGHWVLRGTLLGKETTHDVDAEWVLNREYIRLHEVSREKDSTGKATYEAIVLVSWDSTAREYACLWLDTTMGGGLSAAGIGHAKPQGDGSMPFVWASSPSEHFHNTFVYEAAADAWQWIMDNDRDGQLRPFARLRLTRR